MSNTLQQDQSTPIDAIQGERVQVSTAQQNNGELVDNVQNTYEQMNSDEEGDMSDDMYSRQMMGDVNEPMAQYNNLSQNGPAVQSRTNALVNSIKPSLIVLIIYFVLGIGLIQNVIKGGLSRLIGSENPRLGLFNLSIRSVLAALLFFVINKFI